MFLKSEISNLQDKACSKPCLCAGRPMLLFVTGGWYFFSDARVQRPAAPCAMDVRPV